MTQKGNIASVVLIIALITGYFFFQNKIDALELQLKSTEVAESINFIATDNNSLESQLEDLSNQLIAARSELHFIQQKLILSASKTAVLDDSLSQANRNLDTLKPIQKELKDTRKALELIKLEQKASDKKYNQLMSNLTSQNEVIINRALDRIKLLNQTSSGVSMTASVPFVGAAALIFYTRDQTKKSCEDIRDIIENEQKSFGKVNSLTTNMLYEYQAKCQ